MTRAEFIKLANRERLANKDNWVFLTQEVEGKIVRYKAYRTWIQRISCEQVLESSASDLTVGAFKQQLQEKLDFVLAGDSDV